MISASVHTDLLIETLLQPDIAKYRGSCCDFGPLCLFLCVLISHPQRSRVDLLGPASTSISGGATKVAAGRNRLLIIELPDRGQLIGGLQQPFKTPRLYGTKLQLALSNTMGITDSNHPSHTQSTDPINPQGHQPGMSSRPASFHLRARSDGECAPDLSGWPTMRISPLRFLEVYPGSTTKQPWRTNSKLPAVMLTSMYQLILGWTCPRNPLRPPCLRLPTKLSPLACAYKQLQEQTEDEPCVKAHLRT